MAVKLKALADPVRLQLFSAIASHTGGEACVCDISIGVQVSQPTVSHHLRVLRDAGLLTSQRRASWVYYAVVPDAASVARVMPVLRALRLSGLSVQMHAGGAEGMGSMKSQFKKADASGARVALIFGADDLAQNSVALKPLRGERGEEAPAQALLAMADVAAIAERLRAA